MKVLVTGAGGQVGRALVSTSGVTQLVALGHAELDIIDAQAVRRAVFAFRPNVIINAAAYTAVDKAESEREHADAVNRAGAANLAEAASAIGDCRLIQLSTDYVFSGDAKQPYGPDAATGPLSVYGVTKAAGERAVCEVLGSRAVVLRTAWVFAPEGKNFLLTMLRLMSERTVVRVVSDQWGVPTAVASIARALWRLVELPTAQGFLHWTDQGVTTWYEFAQTIAEEARSIGLLSREVEVVPISTMEYPTTARRPAYSVLDLEESAAKLGLVPVPWKQSLRATLRQIAVRRRYVGN
jgi:dTDP-4-dehydrorhamnose reductase